MVSFNSFFIFNNMYYLFFEFYMAYVQDFKRIFRIKTEQVTIFIVFYFKSSHVSAHVYFGSSKILSSRNSLF